MKAILMVPALSVMALAATAPIALAQPAAPAAAAAPTAASTDAIVRDTAAIEREIARLEAGGLAMHAAITKVLAQPTPPAAASGPTDASTILHEITHLEALNIAVHAALLKTEPDPLYPEGIPQSLQIAGDGWIYDRAQSLARGRHNPDVPPARKIIKSEISDSRIVVYNNNTAISTFISDTYYEVLNPELVAEQQGTLSEDPAALAKVAAAETQKPREGEATNPYRVRTTHIWVLDGGQWKLAFVQDTPITERFHPGS